MKSSFPLGAMLLFLSSCGGGSSISGTWAVCLAGTASATKATYVFSGSTVTYTEEGFSNATCTGTATSVTSSSTGTFVEATSTTLASATNIDITYASGTKAGTQLYQIYQINNSLLYFGDVASTYNGSTVALRPIAISTIGYGKQ